MLGLLHLVRACKRKAPSCCAAVACQLRGTSLGNALFDKWTLASVSSTCQGVTT